MDDLKKARERIDKIDDKLVPLFEERLRAGEEVARAKAASGDKSVFRPERERQVLARAEEALKDKRFSSEIRQLMGAVMDVNKDYQKKLLLVEKAVYPRAEISAKAQVGFFGDNGSHSHVASEKFFPEASARISCPTFREVAEHWERIRQHLAGVDGASEADVREVYSHPQGISQCTEYFSDRPEVSAIPFGNTAKAAAYVARCGEKSKAAICSRAAAKLYGLKILASDINSQNDNYTRFIVIAPKMKSGHGDKISVMFTLGNTPGALYGVLRHFAYNGINLTKMESRPQKNKPGEYIFYVDISGNAEEAERALAQVRAECGYYKMLGEYDRSEIDE